MNFMDRVPLRTAVLGGAGDAFSDAAADWNIAERNSLDGSPGPAIAVTRNSGATMYNRAGVNIYAPENLVENSADIGGPGWNVGANVTITQDAITDPDGGPNGNLLADLDSTGSGAVRHIVGSVGTPTMPLRASVYIKRVSTTGVLRISNSGSPVEGDWDVDLSALSDEWELITASHAAVTVNAAFTLQGTNDGLKFDTDSGTVSIHAYGGQLNRGSYLWPHVLNTSTTLPKYDGARLDTNPATLLPRGLLFEKLRENVCLMSEDFSITWTQASGVVVTPNALVAPNGLTVMSLLTDNNVVDQANASQIVAGVAANSEIWCGSAHIPKDAIPKTTRWPLLALNFANGGTSTWAQIGLDTSTGEFNGIKSSGGGTFINGGVIECKDDWRVWIAFQNDATGNVDVSLQCSPAGGDNVDLSTTDGTVTGAAGFWGAQIEKGSEPSSYIPTTTAAVTREADAPATSDVTWHNPLENTWYAEIEYDVASALKSTNFCTVDATGDVPRQGFSVSSDKLNQVSHDGVGSVISGDEGGRTDIPAGPAVTKMASRYVDASQASPIQSFKDDLGSGSVTDIGHAVDLSGVAFNRFLPCSTHSASIHPKQIWIRRIAHWDVDKGAGFVDALVP